MSAEKKNLRGGLLSVAFVFFRRFRKLKGVIGDIRCLNST